MSWNGLEIEMLSLGDADSIVVTRWLNDVPTRVLIDGGNKSDAKTVRGFLEDRGIEFVDHVVCSHPHDDHSGGLSELVEDTTLDFGKAWMHIPQNHVDLDAIHSAVANAAGVKTAQLVEASVQTGLDLLDLFALRGIHVEEPFQGSQIGFLEACGPTETCYEELLAELADAGKLRELDSYFTQSDVSEYLTEKFGIGGKAAAVKSSSLLDDPQTDPLNNTSTVLATKFNSRIYLFTADAGAPALAAAANAYGDLANLNWMQLPHHGSRRNITQVLIEHFAPKWAFVSAAGNQKHPRRAVVNAFKKQGAKVFSTHYPKSGALRHHDGEVPDHDGYSPAIPLWEAED